MTHDITNRIENDFQIRVWRTGGVYGIEWIGMPIPQDIKEAQKLITDKYGYERRRLAMGFKQSKLKFKQQKDEAIVEQRKIKELMRQAEGASDGR